MIKLLRKIFWETPQESVDAIQEIPKEPDLLTKMLQLINEAKNNPRSYSCPACSNGWLMDYSDKDNPKLKPCPHT